MLGIVLMLNSQVYLPAIEGYVPQDMVQTFRSFLEFCYPVRRDIITDTTLTMIQESLEHFHHYRNIFSDVVATFSLPRQHAMKHYPDMIRLFGAPNGLYLSITESKHICYARSFCAPTCAPIFAPIIICHTRGSNSQPHYDNSHYQSLHSLS